MEYEKKALTACLGKTIRDVYGLDTGSDSVRFTFDDDSVLSMRHSQDCCETVTITQVDGDGEDLLGSPLLMAELVSSDDAPVPEFAESYTWTFIKFGTVKGYVTLRWLGESNGFYGETPFISYPEG
jgi:hypothetical protein